MCIKVIVLFGDSDKICHFIHKSNKMFKLTKLNKKHTTYTNSIYLM